MSGEGHNIVLYRMPLVKRLVPKLVGSKNEKRKVGKGHHSKITGQCFGVLKCSRTRNGEVKYSRKFFALAKIGRTRCQPL